MATKAITNVTAVTCDAERRVIRGAVLLIEDDVLAAVGPASDVALPPGVEILDGGGMVAIPGLINTHTHVPQILLRGSPSQGRQLYDWLYNILVPGLAAFDPGDFECGTLLYCVEGIRSGMTTVVANEDACGGDYERAAGPSMAAYARTGMRVRYARMMRDQIHDAAVEASGHPFPDQLRAASATSAYPTERALLELESLIRRYDGTNRGRVRVWPAPGSVLGASTELYRGAQKLAAERGTMWTIHLCETTLDRSVLGSSPAAWLEEQGLVDQRLLAAHCVDFLPDDIRIFARHEAAVATQPGSNAYLGSGVAPVPAMLRAGIRVGLGTDDANCNDSVNLFKELRLAALLHQAVNGDADILTPQQLLDMATITAAEAIGEADRLGSLEVGKEADIVLVDLYGSAATVPVHDPVTTLVFQASGSEVDTVLIGGDVIMRHGQLSFLTDAEERDLCGDAQARGERLVLVAGLS
jgi:atrazine chlorohydrolase/5-methylthioadenosine/S-adenosylhomocysteine deaminase/melamine deaminase